MRRKSMIVYLRPEQEKKIEELSDKTLSKSKNIERLLTRGIEAIEMDRSNREFLIKIAEENGQTAEAVLNAMIANYKKRSSTME